MRILMVGNSLTTANSMPDILADILRSRLQCEVEIALRTRGGSRLAEYTNPKTRMGSAVLADFTSSHWDYLIMQDMSNAPVTTPEKHRQSISRLASLARENGATPVLYGTWAYRPDSKRLSNLCLDYDEMHTLMHDHSLEAAICANCLFADAATAFFAAEDVSLYAPDGVHPSLKGSELAASVIADAIANNVTETERECDR